MKKHIALLLCLALLFTLATPVSAAKGTQRFLGELSKISALETPPVQEMELTVATDLIYQTWIDVAPSVDLSACGISPFELQSILQVLLSQVPLFYYVNNTYQYTVDENGKVLTAEFLYLFAPEVVEQQLDEIEAELRRVLAGVESDMEQWELVLYIYNYFALNYEYDYDNLIADTLPDESYNIYGLFVRKKSVCTGYANGFLLLMNLLDIESIIVTSEEMNHAWNMVMIDNNWYHVDATWADYVPDILGAIDQEYCLVSDEKIRSMPYPHTGWNSNGIQAADTTYDDAFWIHIKSGLFYEAGAWYYMQNGIIKQYKAGVVRDIYNTYDNLSWDMRFAAYGGMLYYSNTNQIFELELNGTQRKTLFTTEPNAMIGGVAIQNGNMLYYSLFDPQTSQDLFRYRLVELPTDRTLVLGDTNRDQEFNSVDVIYLSRVLAGKETTNKYVWLWLADINEDGVINAHDITMLARVLVGKATLP